MAQKQLEELCAATRDAETHPTPLRDLPRYLGQTIEEFGKDGPDQLAAWRCTLEPGIAFLATCQEALGAGISASETKKEEKAREEGEEGPGARGGGATEEKTRLGL